MLCLSSRMSGFYPHPKSWPILSRFIFSMLPHNFWAPLFQDVRVIRHRHLKDVLPAPSPHTMSIVSCVFLFCFVRSVSFLSLSDSHDNRNNDYRHTHTQQLSAGLVKVGSHLLLFHQMLVRWALLFVATTPPTELGDHHRQVPNLNYAHLPS